MSQFSPTTVACPQCGTAVPFDAVHSVNGERAPELREAIMAETFQRMRCPECGATFRLEPDFNYVDHANALWIAVRPLGRLLHWSEEEERALGLFERVYAQGSPYLKGLAPTLRRRVVFGWAALREKLLVDDLGLRDLDLELLKSAVLGQTEEAPIGVGAELRLVAGSDRTLGFAWLDSEDESVGELMQVERSEYDAMAGSTDAAWVGLREELAAGSFVDVNRLLVPAPA